MARLLTLYEDRQARLSLTEQEKLDILSLRDTLGGSNTVSVQVDGTVLIRQYVGFVVSNRTRLQILPKIYSNNAAGNPQQEARDSIELLFRLLHYSGFDAVKELPNPQTISACDNDILEVFISIFASRFIRLFSQDMHRNYEDYEENMQFIKGKILFPDSLRKNAYRRHLHYVHYQEFTVDTLLNQIFKTVMLRLLSHTQNSENKKKLKLALVYMEDVKEIRLSKSVFEQVRFNRLNSHCRPLFNMARMFYHNLQPGTREGDEYTFTFLVPLNRLFEYYVYKLLRSKHGNEVQYQKPQKYLAKRKDSGVFLLRPDITISRDGEVVEIIDAKYKNPFRDGQPGDLYQVLAYATRYRCNRIRLVYPMFLGVSQEDSLDPFVFETAQGEVTLDVDLIDLTSGAGLNEKFG